MSAPVVETLAAVALGGALGAFVRGRLVRACSPVAADRILEEERRDPHSAWEIAGRALGAARATLLANWIGAFALGLLPLLDSAPVPLALLFGTGFCGALSTFSTLCADAVLLAPPQAPRRTSLLYLGAQAIGGMAAFAAGRGLASLA